MKHKKTNLRISHNKQLVLYLLNLGTIFCMTAFQILHFLSNSLLLWDNCLKHIKIICFLMSHYVFLFAPWGEKWDIIHQYASYKCGNRHLREALMIRICSKLYSLSSLTLVTNRKNFFFCLSTFSLFWSLRALAYIWRLLLNIFLQFYVFRPLHSGQVS